jgi:hypothetical protein
MIENSKTLCAFDDKNFQNDERSPALGEQTIHSSNAVGLKMIIVL